MAITRKSTFHNSTDLYNFDVYPKVLAAGKEAEIHIVNLGFRQKFTVGKEYDILICGFSGSTPERFPATGDFQTEKAVCDENGGFTFHHTFTKEQEYILYAEHFNEDGRKFSFEISVYCVEDGLIGRYPFRGDMHMHTNCSDGAQTPEVVSAVYRGHGYDFFAITDHHRYYPSLRAIDFYKNIPTEFVIVPGEEVHLPEVAGMLPSVHIVNFGGEYSINAQVEGDHTEEVGKDKKFRSIREDCPEVMTHEQYEEKMLALSREITVPGNVDAIPAAVYNWIFSEIRKANGLGIFAHPTWVTDHTFHVSDAMNDYFVENKLFDAFEVLGGENYYEQNGFQTQRYYEDRAKGHFYPIVGSTDSHCCYDYNRNALICSTIVFSPENERKALISSVKDFYSIAVDTISEEFRLVGEMRLVRYGCFLMKNYFPVHDELCYEEGRLMKQYAVGTADEKEEAVKTLGVINGRMKKLREKYFDF